MLLVVLSLPAGAAWAATDTVLILHTNDLHDRLLPNSSGQGGLPYVAAAVQQVRRERRDVLVLDAGDVVEKGDMVSVVTQGAVMYEAMQRVGYDAAVPGNHDFTYGLDRLVSNARLVGIPFLCANPSAARGNPAFEPSRVFEVDGVKVGVIGLSALNQDMDIESTRRILVREADKLAGQTDLLVVLAHIGTADCRQLAEAAPEADVFVTGHTHEVVEEPIVVAKTGAILVQAGSMARYVGRLEVKVDRDTKKVVGYQGGLVDLPHASSPCDTEMLAWARKREGEVCPEARRVVARDPEGRQGVKLARLYAEALRWKTKADVALVHDSLLRDRLYPGEVTVNDLFRTYVNGVRREVVEVALSGQELRAILNASLGRKGALGWAGFTAKVEEGEPAGRRIAECDLAAGRTYRVAMTRGDWNAWRDAKRLKLGDRAEKACDTELISAAADYLAAQTDGGREK